MRRSLSTTAQALRKADFFFDAVSPYAYLAFERLHADAHKNIRDRIDLRFRPLVLGAVLQHHGSLGPAEVAPKRSHTYRQVSYIADKLVKVPIHFPARHPFNSLHLQRLAVACSDDPEVGPPASAVKKILHFVWGSGDGLLGDDSDRLKRLVDELKPKRDPNSQEVKDELRNITSDATAKGIFGVPTLSIESGAAGVGPYNFWGLDCLEQGMVKDCLDGDPFFTSEKGGWHIEKKVTLGPVRTAAAGAKK
jgi:2-hydroxychromene-2-carboxylate isomerase